MKKIALLLSGLPRMWQPCLATQLDMFRDHHVDVYCHFWDTIDAAEKDALLQLLKPKAYQFETPQDFSAFDNNPDIKLDKINLPSRMASQFYSWRRVAALFEPFAGEYEFAMRSRSDLQFVYSVEHILEQLKPNDLVIEWCVKDYLISDIFALGDARVILYYLKLFNCLPDYAKSCVFNPEALLTHHLERYKDLHIYADSFRYYFVRRPHMASYTIEQCMLEQPGDNKWLNPEVVETHKEFFRKLSGNAGDIHVDNFRQERLESLAAGRGRA